MKILLVSRRSFIRSSNATYLKNKYSNYNAHIAFKYHWGSFWYKALENLQCKVIPFAFSKNVLVDRLFGMETYLTQIESGIRRRLKLIANIEAARINKSFLRAVTEQKPDIVFLDTAEVIFPESLKAIRLKYPSLIIINWLLDDPFLQQTWSNVVESFRFCDCIFIFDPFYIEKIRNKGAKNVVYMPGACDPDIHHTNFKDNVSDFKIPDICFVGTVTPQRAEFLRNFNDYNFGIWTRTSRHILCAYDLLKYYKGQAYGEKASFIYSMSKISLNHHHFQSIYGTNLRTFEIAGSRGFQLLDYKKEVNGLFEEGSEIITCKDMPDYNMKIDYYLSHEDERKEIAKNAQQRAYKEHTYSHRMRDILDIVKSL